MLHLFVEQVKGCPAVEKGKEGFHIANVVVPGDFEAVHFTTVIRWARRADAF